MTNTARELTAYCGLYCGDCIRYKSKAADLARKLLSELRDTEFNKYADVKSRSIKEFRRYQECCDALQAIVELQCNESCRTGGGCPTFSCSILECCQKKELEGCWECDEYESCSNFDFLKPYHGDATVQNLRIIKEMGLDRWLEHRQKFFVWQ